MTCVSAIMSTKVTTVCADLPLYDLISLLVDRNFAGAPVVDLDGRAIGMVSRSDLIWEDHDWADSRSEANSRTVSDVMTTGALSVLPSCSIKEASRLMISNHVHRMPVVDERERLVGIVTTFDITRWVAQAA
jgi:CBS domain-containing protein